MTERNPFEHADRQASRVRGLSGVTVGTVTSSPTFDPKSGTIQVEVVTPQFKTGTYAPVMTPSHGSGYVPEQGTDVIVAPHRTYDIIILGAKHSYTVPPGLEPGEHVVSHPASDAEIRFRPDGTLAIDGDFEVEINDAIVEVNNGDVQIDVPTTVDNDLDVNGDVVINGGSRNPIVDITTNTDADGHVTSVSTTKANNIFL